MKNLFYITLCLIVFSCANEDKKIQELERDVGNLKFQVSEYQQIVEELSEKLANYSRIKSQNNE